MLRYTRAARLVLLMLLAALMLTATLAGPARAAGEPRYIAATGHYLSGIFQAFWDANGGLQNFGYPITDEYIDASSGRVFQYFERARFERDTSDSTQVTLGLLGREYTAGRTFATATPITSTTTRRYFPQTGQIVQYGFKEIWETRGGQPIFGLPLSGEIEEQLDDGQTYTVQYFERARFEYHPSQPAGQRVLISLLGRKLAPAALTAPLPPTATPPALTEVEPTSPTEAPSLVRPLVPAAKNAIVYPMAGKPGDVFIFTAGGFEPNEQVAVWVNVPDGQVIGDEAQFQADSRGTITDAGLFFRTFPGYPPGLWSIVAQGVTSERTATAFFLLVSSPISNADSTTDQLSVDIPDDIDAQAEPRSGSIGEVFFFEAHGFQPGEEVQVTITAADGTTTNTVTGIKADSGGGIGYLGLYYASSLTSPPGLYNMTATGRASGKRSIAYFVVLPG
jgi:hypothetical protein